MFFVGCGPAGGPFDELNEAYTSQCPTATVEGVDTYHLDEPVSYTTLQASGRVFAFMKATQSTDNLQSDFVANWQMTKALGMLRGPYHYFDATVDGVAQANWFLMNINQAGGIGAGDLPPVLDLECPTSPTMSDAGNYCLTGSQASGGKNGWAPTATIIQRVWDFLDTVEAGTGMRPIIYTYPSWTASFGFTDPKLATYPLWIAGHNSTMTCASVPLPWTAATFWQYSTGTAIAGIHNDTMPADLDRFIGTQMQLNAFVAGDIQQDGGDDGMTASDGGGVDDLATSGPDLAPPPDLAHAVDLGHDGGSVKKSSAKGCGCQVGGRGEAPAPLWLLLLVLALFARRAMIRG
jgi:lysozyme